MRDKNLFLEEKYSFLYKTVGRYKNNSSSRSFSIISQSFEIKFIKKEKKNFPTPTGSDYFIVSSGESSRSR